MKKQNKKNISEKTIRLRKKFDEYNYKDSFDEYSTNLIEKLLNDILLKNKKIEYYETTIKETEKKAEDYKIINEAMNTKINKILKEN